MTPRLRRFRPEILKFIGVIFFLLVCFLLFHKPTLQLTTVRLKEDSPTLGSFLEGIGIPFVPPPVLFTANKRQPVLEPPPPPSTQSPKPVGKETVSLTKEMVYSLDQKDPKLIRYIRDHHLTPPPNETGYHGGVNPNSISRYVMRQFKDKGRNWKGTFIEAGAYDGVIASNSHYLEDNGWSGLLIECNPLLLPKLRANHRKAWISDVCISPEPTPKLMNFTTLSEWPASAKLGAPLSPAEMKHDGIDWVANKTWINYEITCFPLYSIVKATGAFHQIDFLSLDVEGAEFDILKNFPFDSFPIKTLFVEVHTFTEAKKTELRTFMKSKGYKLAKKLQNDDSYVLESERFPDVEYH